MRKLLFAILVVFVILIPNCASAQHVSPHLMLARMCAHEASLPIMIDGQWMRQRDHTAVWGPDCWIIHTVILRGAHRIQSEHPGMTIQRAYVISAVNYSHHRIESPPPTDTNRWAADLNPEGHEPRGWHGLPWAHSRPAWEYVYEMTATIVRTPLEVMDGPESPLHCDGTVEDWGSRADRPGALRRGLIELHCDGNPANIAFSRPHRR